MEERALTTGEIIGLATEKVNLGRRLVNDLKDLLHIPGVQRMQKQISSQTNVLLSAINDGSISVLQINSSKLLHLECLVKILRKCRAITSVDYVLPLRESEADPMRMDVVCENGTCTVNVEAKNLHTLSNSLNEAASTGHQRIVNQAEEFVEAATNNAEGEGPIPPQVCLIFDNELENGGAKGVDENSLMDFVNSIVHTNIAEPVDKSWEFQASPGKEQKTRDQREYKRIQMQQRRANPIIRTADNDRKRAVKSDNRDEEGLDPPRKFIRADGTLTEEQLTPGDVEDPQFKPEVGVYEVVQAETDTVVVAPEETYNTSQSYFCENCKAYEQEILRLREQLKRKDNLIKSLEASQAPLNAE